MSHHIRILIVEDEPLLGLMLAEEVKDLGCQTVEVVTNGRAAIEAVHRDCPDAILMDISLPGQLDGIETARGIKAIKDLPLLFLTGSQDRALLSRALDADPVGIVNKLDTTETIRAAIASLLCLPHIN